MKKWIVSTAAAAALLASPLAGGKADAVQPNANQNAKVYYYYYQTGDFANYDNWCGQYFYYFNPETGNWKKQKAPTGQQPSKQQGQKPAQPAPAPAPAPEKQPGNQEQQKPAEQNGYALSAYEQQVVDLTNAERQKAGLAPLKVDLALSKVAREKSRDMAANNYFDHNSPTYGSPFDMMKKFGISYRSAGENIAKGQRTPKEVVQAWMNSQGHRENILNSSYTHIGVGYVENGNYWTQQFIGK